MHSLAFLRILEPSWAVLGVSRARLGLSWACLGPSWGSLGGILGLSWTHVGTFWARFGASWGRLEAVLDCHGAAGVVLNGFEPSWAVLGRFCAHSGVHFGPKIGSFLVIFGVIFCTQFWALFGLLLGWYRGFNLAPDRLRKASRWDQKGHRELQRPKKLQLQKHSKTICFSKFLGSRGLPEKP